MTYYQSNRHMVETLEAFIKQQHWTSCLRSNYIDEGLDINSLMLTPPTNYSVSNHLSRHTFQYSQTQQQRAKVLDIESPLNYILTHSLPDQFLKKLHCILTYEILPSHIYWNSNQTSFTICFKAELVYKYLPQIFQFFSISNVVKLLTNYGFKKTKRQKKGIQNYVFQHPKFLPLQPRLIDSIILEYPNIDPYGELVDYLLNQFNYCKLNGYSLELEISTLVETNLGLKNELEQIRYNIEQLNLIMYFLETGQLDKINLEEFNILIADFYQLPEAMDTQTALIIPPTPQSLILPVTTNSVSALTPMEFDVMDTLTTSETSVYDFVAPTSFKLPSSFSQAHILSICNNSFGIPK